MCGIGGRTIEEAQTKLSYEEVQRWARYRKNRGSLNQSLRIERAIAMLATLYANSKRRKGAPPIKIYEFMPYENEPAISLNDAMKRWR